MTEQPLPGRSLVTRRALIDVIRPAVLGSYGVVGFASPTLGRRVLGWFGVGEPGVRIALRQGLTIDLHLTVAYGLPVAEVARQADSAVRYALRRATGRPVERLTIHVGGMRYQPVVPPPVEPAAEPPAGEEGAVSLAAIEEAVLAGGDGGGEPA